MHDKISEVERVFYTIIYWLLMPLLKLFYRLEARGVENTRGSGATLYAANHKSYLDPIVVAIPVYPKRLHFMAKAELWKIPVLRWIITNVNAFPVQRRGADRKAIVRSLEILRAGGNLLIFPEGTRIRKAGLGPAHKGMAAIAVKTGARIIPVGVSGTDRIWPEGKRLPRVPKVIVSYGEPLDPRDYDGNKDELAKAVMHEIGKLIGYDEGPRLTTKEVFVTGEN